MAPRLPSLAAWILLAALPAPAGLMDGAEPPVLGPAPVLRPPPGAYEEGFRSVSEALLKAWLGFLASPELEGRESGTRGYDVASRYVATIFEGIGVAPFGDPSSAPAGTRSYFQSFDLVKRSWDLEGAVIHARRRDRSGPEPDAIPLKGQVSMQARREIDWEDPWVFVGNGEGAESDSPDDFQGVDLERSVLVILPREGKASGEARGALAAGARRIVVISDERARKGPPPVHELPENLLLENEKERSQEVVYISRTIAERILERSGAGLDKLSASRPERTRVFEPLSIRIRLPRAETRRSTRNVVAFLEGRDPRLKGEFVLVGAHLDHIGVMGGKTFFGADDDASGVSAMLGVARAFSENSLRPRRSVIFVGFAAEEKGLFGSRWFVDHLGFPLERIVLAIQLDMIGRNEEVRSQDRSKAEAAEDNIRSIHVVGAKRHSRELDPWVRSANELVGLDLEYDEERLYPRSDQYTFGTRGVPVAFFCSGFHPDYHQASDTPDKINYGKVAAVTRLVFALSFEVADRERKLRINRL